MKVLISGAGIAGLPLALRLHQRGITPIVVERSRRLRDGGYMLGLSDPGFDAAEQMGIAEALKAAEYLPKRLVYLARDGREKFALESAALTILSGDRQLNLMRGDIERTLYDRVRDNIDIRLGTSVDRVEMANGGVQARLEAQVIVSPRWAERRAVLLGDAGYAVSLIAGKGATLAMAGGVLLADALADMPGDIDGALARYEARLRPIAEGAQAMARRNVNLFTPANWLQLHIREVGLRLATLPPVARLAKRLLNPPGERL